MNTSVVSTSGPAPATRWATASMRLGKALPWLRIVFVAVVSVAAFAFGASILLLPDARSRDAPPDVFSAERAMDHVTAIATEPHPAGSGGMAQVAAYLMMQLQQLGLDVEPIVERDPQTGVVLRVVAGRVRGSASTGAVLFVAHPDSVAEGPGAGDNATGAATLLETARALTAEDVLRNDVIFLFDDGEELGYRGAEMFATRHPWMSDVKLVVGIDTAAWGVPSLMQDSQHNGVAIRGYARGVAHPVALGFDASTNREDGSEIDVFRQRGLPGIEIEDTYANVVQHTDDDTIDRVDTRSLQLMGDQILGLARAYGDMDLSSAKAPDRVFFTLPIVGLVHYPAAWSISLGVLALFGSVGVIFVALRWQRILGRGVALGFCAALVMVLSSVVMAAIAAWIYEQLYPDPRTEPLGEYLLPSSAPFAVAVLVAIGLTFILSYFWVASRMGEAELGVGFLVLWGLFSTLCLFITPVGVYLFQWPLLVAVGIWIWLLTDTRRSSLILVAPGGLAIMLLAPQLLLAYFASGVADLPLLALGTLAIGLICPAAAGLEGRRQRKLNVRSKM